MSTALSIVEHYHPIPFYEQSDTISLCAQSWYERPNSLQQQYNSDCLSEPLYPLARESQDPQVTASTTLLHMQQYMQPCTVSWFMIRQWSAPFCYSKIQPLNQGRRHNLKYIFEILDHHPNLHHSIPSTLENCHHLRDTKCQNPMTSKDTSRSAYPTTNDTSMGSA